MFSTDTTKTHNLSNPIVLAHTFIERRERGTSHLTNVSIHIVSGCKSIYLYRVFSQTLSAVSNAKNVKRDS